MDKASEITPVIDNNAIECSGGDEELFASPAKIVHAHTKALVTENIVVSIPDTSNGKNNSPMKCDPQHTSVSTTTTTTSTVSITPSKETMNQTPQSPVKSPSSPILPPPPPPQLQKENDKTTKTRRTSEATTRSLCPICEKEAIKKKNVLKCSTCTHLIHFTCTNLPPYMLHSLSSSNKKYTCEICAATPETFLTSIVIGICGASGTSESTGADNRIEVLEHKVNSIVVALEKFDIQTVAENLNALGNKMEQANNNLTGNVRAIQKMKVEQEVSSSEVKTSNVERQTSDDLQQLRNELETAKKELSASQSSNDLLMKTVTERDKLVVTLREKWEKNVQKLNEREKRVIMLEGGNTNLTERNQTLSNEKMVASEQWSTKCQSLGRERDHYHQKIEEIQNKLLEARSKLDATLEVNGILKKEVKELVALNKSLQDSISRPPARRNLDTDLRETFEQDVSEDEEEDEARDEVVILHDSMCKNVNNTLLSREGISVNKVWAPDMEKMEEALDEVDSKVVVLEAFTRDLGKMDIEEMNQKIAGLVSKAATKADKVVLSTIIRREDIEDIDLKADLVNAFIKLKYKKDENVIVCDNYKLYDSWFRKADKLHLNDDGVPIFASNLKYAIAAASGIQVKKKNRRGNSVQGRDNGGGYQQRDDRYNRR